MRGDDRVHRWRRAIRQLWRGQSPGLELGGTGSAGARTSHRCAGESRQCDPVNGVRGVREPAHDDRVPLGDLPSSRISPAHGRRAASRKRGPSCREVVRIRLIRAYRHTRRRRSGSGTMCDRERRRTPLATSVSQARRVRSCGSRPPRVGCDVDTARVDCRQLSRRHPLRDAVLERGSTLGRPRASVDVLLGGDQLWNPAVAGVLLHADEPLPLQAALARQVARPRARQACWKVAGVPKVPAPLEGSSLTFAASTVPTSGARARRALRPQGGVAP